MTMKQCGVYKIINSITGDFYIGSSNNIDSRVYQHRYELSKNKHGNQHFQRAWKKYGEQAFVFKTILLCDPENKLYYEQVCIDTLKPAYNIAKNARAPMQGVTMSKETRKKLSIAHRGKIMSEESRKKMSETQKIKARRGNKHPRWVEIPDDKIDEIETMIEWGWTYEKISSIFGISRGIIKRRGY